MQIASAAFGTIIRGGCGVLCSGYNISFQGTTPDNVGQYSVLPNLPFGLRLKESSAVSGFHRPQQPITLYERQDCAGCRKVRETASVLDLDILLVPRPEGGRSTWPEETQPSDHKGNPTQLPFMIDPNTGFEMSDADDIVSYLFRTYGNRNRIPMALRPGVIADATAKLALAHRNGAGEKATACAGSTCLPTGFIPLEFWGYEGSPFCVVVKEVLGELEIPHMQRSCARGSPKRQVLFDRRGQFQVPYVEDLNTGVALFESSAIIEYLRKTYGNGRGEEMKV